MEPTKEVGHIGKSVLIKGELSGSEDLYIDGEIEGTIELRGHSLTIGPNGRIRANLNARDVVIHGKVNGNVQANERVDLRKTAVLTGNIVTKRIAIEDGAFFKGGVDIQKDTTTPAVDARREQPHAATAAAGSSSAVGSGKSTPASPVLSQMDHKKS